MRSCGSSQCELRIEVVQSVIKFSDVGVDVGTICDTLRIQDTKTKFNIIRAIKTCPPKIVNGIINLEVINAEAGCKVNSEIKYSEIPTTSLPSADKLADLTSSSSFELWKILLIIIVGLIVFGIFAFFG
uniref:Uncharacterized protein n=1 Tax=Panagrolaimus superbus TaxID=310955 RepID=A0A914Y8I5_9BILA